MAAPVWLAAVWLAKVVRYGARTRFRSNIGSLVTA
jgi:hypothetical protein